MSWVSQLFEMDYDEAVALNLERLEIESSPISEKKLKSHLRKLSKRYHPDTASGETEIAELTEKFKSLQIHREWLETYYDFDKKKKKRKKKWVEEKEHYEWEEEERAEEKARLERKMEKEKRREMRRRESALRHLKKLKKEEERRKKVEENPRKEEISKEIEELLEKKKGLKGPKNKVKRNKTNQMIKELQKQLYDY